MYCRGRESLPYRTAYVNELEMRLIDEWPCFDQSIVDADTCILASGAVVSALVSVEQGTRLHQV